MDRQEAVPTDVTFHDASGYFSEEEWKLLQDWQKDLYSSMMQQIHQALISLGPLIATTVFSLKAKEKQRLSSVDTSEPERSHSIHGSPKDEPVSIFIDHLGEEVAESRTEPTSGGDLILLHIKNEEDPPVLTPQEQKRAENLVRLSEDEPVSSLIDDLGEDVKESRTDPTSGGDLILLHMKNEEELPELAPLERKRKKNFCRSAGDESLSIKRKAGFSVAGTEKSTTWKGLHEETAVKVAKCTEREANSRSQLSPGSNQEVGESNSGPCQRADTYPEHCILQENASDTPSHGYDHAFTLWNVNQGKSPPNAQSLPSHFACPECEKCFTTKQKLSRHRITHSGVNERPYQCTECGKSFVLSHHLTQHQRTHTGERPFQCTECNKCFTLKGNLNKHQKTHTVTNRLKKGPYK